MTHQGSLTCFFLHFLKGATESIRVQFSNQCHQNNKCMEKAGFHKPRAKVPKNQATFSGEFCPLVYDDSPLESHLIKQRREKLNQKGVIGLHFYDRNSTLSRSRNSFSQCRDLTSRNDGEIQRPHEPYTIKSMLENVEINDQPSNAPLVNLLTFQHLALNPGFTSAYDNSESVKLSDCRPVACPIKKCPYGHREVQLQGPFCRFRGGIFQNGYLRW